MVFTQQPCVGYFGDLGCITYLGCGLLATSV